VIDVETTGLFPSRHDRVIEIAVVHTDQHGRAVGEWETLLNPGRDLGPQHIHGIRASDVLDAPTIADIAPDLVELIDGRVPVAHNASFDRRFIAAELARAGVLLDPDADYLCTMQLARQFLPGVGRSLADCCRALGIVNENAHRALDDARATAAVLEAYIAGGERDFWYEHIDRALDRRWVLPPRGSRPWMPRPAWSAALSSASFLDRIASKLPDLSGPDEHRTYFAYLDRALIDRHLSAHEARGLADLANELGIGRSAVHELHVRYFDSLAAAAWADGVLTDAELVDLALVADLLEIPTSHLAVAAEKPIETDALDGTAFTLRPGDAVVLTGQMTRERADLELELIAAGLVPAGNVSKKVALVVAADPDSLSGKARKARDLGIPVVGEFALPDLLKGLTRA
jgi:DNA polymerase III subunit epsilon